jgi:uncharacterized membrane protein
MKHRAQRKPWKPRLEAAVAAWCLVALVILSVASSLLGAAAWVVLALVALQGMLLLAGMLQPQNEGPFALGAVLFAVFLTLFLVVVPSFQDASDLQHPIEGRPQPSDDFALGGGDGP